MKSYSQRQNKSFANYRVPAIRLQREYQAYEKTFLGTLLDEVQQLQKSKVKELLESNVTDEKELIKQTGEKIIANPEGYLELLTKSQELENETLLCKETFLFDNDFKKLKELCKIVYEDFTELEYENHEELYKFALETFDFFLKSSRDIINSGKSILKGLATKSQTQTVTD